jgi:hypothetical protein
MHNEELTNFLPHFWRNFIDKFNGSLSELLVSFFVGQVQSKFHNALFLSVLDDLTHLSDHSDSPVSHLLVIVIHEILQDWEYSLRNCGVAIKPKLLREKLC